MGLVASDSRDTIRIRFYFNTIPTHQRHSRPSRETKTLLMKGREFNFRKDHILPWALDLSGSATGEHARICGRLLLGSPSELSDGRHNPDPSLYPAGFGSQVRPPVSLTWRPESRSRVWSDDRLILSHDLDKAEPFKRDPWPSRDTVPRSKLQQISLNSREGSITVFVDPQFSLWTDAF